MMNRKVFPFMALGFWLVAGCDTARETGSVARVGADGSGTRSAPDEPMLGRVEQLTNPSMGFGRAGEAYFSPDGEQIIFQAVPEGREGYQIYVMPLADRRPRMVSTGRGECTCAFFRPDGRKIIFASSHLDPGLAATRPADERGGYRAGQRRYVWKFNEHMDIFEADPDGSNLKRLTDAPGYDAEGAYGPDGRRIAFTSQRPGLRPPASASQEGPRDWEAGRETGSEEASASQGGDLEIWVMSADGSDAKQITRAKGYDGGPFISPDGRRIIFRADRRGDDLLQLFVIDIDGGNERQLTDNAFVNWGPYWHPEGRSIVYATSRHGHENYEVYLMNVETGREERVTNSPGFDGLPVFSGDGKRLMWTSKRGADATPQVFIADFELPHGF